MCVCVLVSERRESACMHICMYYSFLSQARHHALLTAWQSLTAALDALNKACDALPALLSRREDDVRVRALACNGGYPVYIGLYTHILL